MMTTLANIIKGVFRTRKRQESNFQKLSWYREKIIKHQDDQSIKTENFPHASIAYKRPYELIHGYREIFENEIYRFTSTSNTPLILDCGSNIGLSVIYFKQIFPASHILAYEPDAGNFEILKMNVQKNALTNVELFQSAVWISNGQISFDSKESEASHISESSSGTTVQSIRLRDVLNSHDKIDFLKMDIEGAEHEVMGDNYDLLFKVQNLFLEYHGKSSEVHKLKEIFDGLNSCGFSVYVRNAADNLSRPFIEKTTGTLYDVQLNLFCYKQ